MSDSLQLIRIKIKPLVVYYTKILQDPSECEIHQESELFSWQFHNIMKNIQI